MSKMNFAIYYVGDGYSTDKKIMGRQSAGKALMNGVARRWRDQEVHGFGSAHVSGQAMLRQLKGDGFQGALRWREAPGDRILEDDLGAVYYPGPLTKEIAHRRNMRGPGAYSLFGVTHTLSSAVAMDLVSDLILPPFKPWDALVCTSKAAVSVVTRLQDELKAWYAEHLGASRFNPIAMPVIPLGVNAPSFARTESQIADARAALGLGADDVAFLFAGRKAFHAKANPAAFYQAVEAAQAKTSKTLVCVEAGVYANTATAPAYEQARRALAPNVRFLEIDGQDEGRYHQAWKAADVFVSLSDNIQETFGITPLEAMAAGLPVLVSDWDGYKDTVRDGVDGYRIPVTLPPVGAGADLAQRHAVGADSYDYYIGRTSMATAVDHDLLVDRIVALADSPQLRRQLGEAGRARAMADYDWPVILDRYVQLVDELNGLRRAAGKGAPEGWALRPDPFALFADYPTHTLGDDWKVGTRSAYAGAIEQYLELGVARYAIDPALTPRETVMDVLKAVETGTESVGELVGHDPATRPSRMRALMWLAKLNLVTLTS